MGADLFLQRTCGHVLAAGGDQEVLLPSRDGEEAVLVQLAKVSGAEESIDKSLSVGLRVGVITAEHTDALDQDFAVFGHADGGARNGNAHRSHLGAGWGVGGARGGGFGQPVPLQYGNAHTPEEV